MEAIPNQETGLLSFDILKDFKFEVYYDDKKRPYTSRIAMTGNHWPIGYIQRCGEGLRSVFSKYTGISLKNLYIMTSQEADAFYVWVRSRVPMPLIALAPPNKTIEPPKPVAKAVIDLELCQPSHDDLSSALLVSPQQRSTSDSPRKRLPRLKKPMH